MVINILEVEKREERRERREKREKRDERGARRDLENVLVYYYNNFFYNFIRVSISFKRSSISFQLSLYLSISWFNSNLKIFWI